MAQSKHSKATLGLGNCVKNAIFFPVTDFCFHTVAFVLVSQGLAFLVETTKGNGIFTVPYVKLSKFLQAFFPTPYVN